MAFATTAARNSGTVNSARSALVKHTTFAAGSGRTNRRSFITLLSALAVVLVASFGGAIWHTAAHEGTPSALPPMVQELKAAWNAHDPQRVAAMFTKDGVVEVGFYDELIARGRDQIAEGFAAPVFATYPDVRFETQEGYQTEDLVVWQWTFTGSYTGHEGLPPGTGQPLTFGGLSLYELRDGHIARKFFFTYDLTFMQQIGFVLELPQGASATGTPAV
jgi:steroid delta-isomerase-like uncharacterized protein